MIPKLAALFLIIYSLGVSIRPQVFNTSPETLTLEFIASAPPLSGLSPMSLAETELDLNDTAFAGIVFDPLTRLAIWTVV